MSQTERLHEIQKLLASRRSVPLKTIMEGVAGQGRCSEARITSLESEISYTVG